MTYFLIAVGLLLLAAVVYAFILERSALEAADSADGEEWNDAGQSEWPAQMPPDRLRTTLPAVTVTFDRSITSLKVGDVAMATVKLNGATPPLTTSCVWAMDVVGIVQIQQSTTIAGLNRITALKPGTVRLIAIAGGYFSPIMIASVAAAPVPVPVPIPTPTPAPAAAWKRTRDWIAMFSTDFYYNWTSSMFALYAHRYDVVMSGSSAHIASIKALNPEQRRVPYALLLTTLIDPPLAALAAPETDHLSDYRQLIDADVDEPSHLIYDDTRENDGLIIAQQAALEHPDQRVALSLSTGNLQTKYLDDCNAWCTAKGLSTAAREAMWLHDLAGKRIVPSIWGSPRNVPDPTDANARSYAIDRMLRIAQQINADGIFLDEYGRGGITPIYAMTGKPIDPYMAASITLLKEISAAMAKLPQPKQLIVNSAAYKFDYDRSCCVAARGTHMEQTNNPLQGDLCGTYATPGTPPQTWSFIDALLAAGVFVNMVPPFQFGEYEAQVGKTGTAHMDTTRGKYLELASYYMVVTDPALLALSIENGDWAKYTPVQNWVPAIDAPIGRAIEQRWRKVTGADAHCWQRRFSNGLVLFQPIWTNLWDRSLQDFGAGNAIQITLPTDRTYFHVEPSTGIAAITPTKQLTLRTPEAAIFICTH